MVLDELLSFRTHFWPSHFPIEARYYEYRSTGSSLTLKARLISTPEELRAFQKEVTQREQRKEWSFLVYYESYQQHDERVSA